MAYDYQSALVDQLDPSQKKKVAPDTNTGFAGGMETKIDAMPTVTDAAPAAAPTVAPSWSPGAKAGQQVTLLGFDRDKLEDPNSGSVAGSKYTQAAKTFYNGLKQDVGLSRGGLDNMLNYAKANGFANAKAVGDDKIDFGDGNGPVDVIRSDGQIVFQNTTGNPVWEGKGYGGGGGSAAPAMGGVPLDSRLTGDPIAAIQAALGQYSSSPNLQELLKQLGAV